MAKQTITLLTDDLDGSEADHTIVFAMDGSSYTIDLNDKHAEEFRKLLATYTNAGTRTGRHTPVANGTYVPGSTVRKSTIRGNRDENAQIREWATKNGYELAERGRIPQTIVANYHRNIPAPGFTPPSAAPEAVFEAPATESAPPRKRVARKPAAAAS